MDIQQQQFSFFRFLYFEIFEFNMKGDRRTHPINYITLFIFFMFSQHLVSSPSLVHSKAIEKAVFFFHRKDHGEYRSKCKYMSKCDYTLQQTRKKGKTETILLD